MNESGVQEMSKKQMGEQEKGVPSLNECYCLVVPLPAQFHVAIVKHKK